MRASLAVLFVGVMVLGAGIARSQAPSATTPPAEHKAIAPGDIQWGDPPPVFNKGAKFSVLYGDPTKPTVYIVRLKMPAGYKIMPHWHPTDENVTVISGSFAVGMGDKMDAKVKGLPAGSFFSMPAKMHHFAVAKGETIVEVAGMGPFQLTYINPEDDPSKQRASATP
jgi:quercetin dioxygenase-like cupin family protein